MVMVPVIFKGVEFRFGFLKILYHFAGSSDLDDNSQRKIL